MLIPMTSPLMKRLGSFAFAIFLSMLPISASASQRQPMVVAKLEEESIPAQDLAAQPGPAAPSSTSAEANPNPDTNPDSGDWEQVPAAKPTPAEQPEPGQQQGLPSKPTPTPAPTRPSEAEPPDVAPAIDVGSIATTPQISDSSLAPLIDTAPTPARAASLRITEQQRVELEQGHTDERDSRTGARDFDRSEQLVRVLLPGARIRHAQGLHAGADVLQARGNRARIGFRVARRNLRVRRAQSRGVG